MFGELFEMKIRCRSSDAAMAKPNNHRWPRHPKPANPISFFCNCSSAFFCHFSEIFNLWIFISFKAMFFFISVFFLIKTSAWKLDNILSCFSQTFEADEFEPLLVKCLSICFNSLSNCFCFLRARLLGDWFTNVN